MTRAGLRVLLACVLLGGPGCGAREPLPEGAWLSGDAAALRAVWTRLARLEGTPLGRFAERAEQAARRSDCGFVVGHAPTDGLSGLVDSLACASPGAEPSAVVQARGDADWLLVAPLSAEQRLVVRGAGTPDGSLELTLAFDPLDEEGLAGLLLPDGRAPGPAVLARDDALVHARVRPRAGLDVARFVADSGQGDRLFRLKSGLFSDAVLAGVWEIAVYMPEAGAPLPPLAVALDVRSERIAREAVERFIAELSALWPVHRTAVRFAAGEGACLFDLRILPGFAPCYALRSGALVLGWNPPSLERALAGSAGPGGASRLTVRLDRLPEADRRLAAAIPATPPAIESYGWQALEIAAGEGDADLVVRLAAER